MMIRALVLLLTALLTSSSPAQQQWDRFTVPPDHITIAVPGEDLPTYSLPVMTPRGQITLQLRRRSMRSADAVALVDSGGPQLEQVPLPAPATFAGEILGWPGSTVAAAVVRGGLRATIDFGAQAAQQPRDLCYIQPAADFGAGEGHVFYSASQVLPGPWVCGGALEPATATPAGGYAPRATCTTIAQIAFDADYPMYTGNGSSVAATIADIESVMIAVDLIYGRDVGIEHQSTGYVIRTVAPDPYTTTSAGGLLDQFRLRWGSFHGSIQRDIAHLMTGRDLDGGVIGVAWVNVMCNAGYGYGLSQVLFTTDMAGRAALVAHELGHNWSAGHCDGDADCSIMCSGIGGCANNLSLLSSRSVTEITNARNAAAACLSTGMPVAHADGVTVVPAQVVLVDVLGNDSTATCGDISLQSFSTSTPLGATVTRSVGTGPNGRDQLRVQVGPTAGEDRVGYSIVNGAGRTAINSLYISVVQPRQAEQPALTAPGLATDYFHTLPLSVTDLPRGTFLSSITVPTVNFPSTDQPIAGGPRQAAVGLILRGTLNIPAAGTYTFYLESDDGSALYVNNQLVLINDGPQGMSEVGGTLTLPVGTASVRIDYVQGGGNAGLIMRVAGPSVTKQVVPAMWWAAPGVAIDFYGIGGLYNDLPDLGQLSRVRSGVVAAVNQPDNTSALFGSARREFIVAAMQGYFEAPQRGIYRFFLTSDDASELRIGAQVVVSNRGAHGMIERSGLAVLEPGLHSLDIDYWQGGGGGGLIASVEGPTLTKQAIPASMLRHAVPDCNGDAIDDRAQVIERLDLGDMAVGGTGRGTVATGTGISPTTGRSVLPTVTGGSRAGGSSIFFPLNGVNGRANFPFVEGVFIPNASTVFAVGQPPFIFSPTSGAGFDCIRKGGTYFEFAAVTPLVMADQAGQPRAGLGMHANSGVTFDLVQIRAANPGRTILGARGVAGLSTDGCSRRDAAAEVFVLLDGVIAYRSVLTDDALAQVFDVAISGTHQFLTLAMLDARTTNCDHFVIADAQLLLSVPGDDDLDGILDTCQCPADFNDDGGVDGADIEAFFVAWESSDPEADTNRDGGVDGSDVETFFRAWEAGGC